MTDTQHAETTSRPDQADAARTILNKVRVLDLTRYLAGPQATLFLAELGADIVRIDDPVKGDPAANAPPFFGSEGISLERQTPDDLGIAYLKRGRGKRSIAIDLKSKKGHELFLRLVKKADILVENFRVGVTKRLGIDYETLAQHNPQLIYASITGYGGDGPECTRKAYDLMVQASSGLMSVTGAADGSAQKAGSPISDGISGTFAVLGILGALYQRTHTGSGQHIDISMTDCLVSLIYDEPWDCYEALGLPIRQGNRIMRFSPFNTYNAIDGMVTVGAATDADWENLLTVMERDDIKRDPNFMDRGWRIQNNSQVDDVVSAWTKKMMVSEIVDLCTARAIPCSELRGIADLERWDQLRHRELLTHADHPGLPEATGPLAASFPLKFSGAAKGHMSPAAMLGEHETSVLDDWLGEPKTPIRRSNQKETDL